MSRVVPTRNLEEVHYAALNESEKPDLCHVYAILRREEVKGSLHMWYLFDEFMELAVSLCGRLEEYPRPKPGDVVRIHRLRIDTKKRRPEIMMGRNVVYWPAFQYDPKPVATAKDPTIAEEDNDRRRVLETLYSSTITRCLDILRSNDLDNHTWFTAVAGCVEDNHLDMFEHHEIQFRDGTEPPVRPDQYRVLPTLRVFKPTGPQDSSSHYEVAKMLRKGQYFVATNVKLARNHRLNLSANEHFGRSLRHVEEASILGVKLKESLGEPECNVTVDLQEPSSSQQPSSQQPSSQLPSSQQPSIQRPSSQQTVNSNGKLVPLRRSPRFSQNPDASQNPQPPKTDGQTTTETAQSTNHAVAPATTVANVAKREPDLSFSRLSEIKPKETGYDFYNLIGQVRGMPQLTKQFNNCVLQLFDGSRHSFASHYDDEFEQMIDGCLVLHVYSKQREHDTNEHFERAMSLKPGDIIFVRNVKVSSRASRVKLELQANKLHNKSINLVDTDSSFGRKILDIVQTPQVEEIFTDEASDSSQEQRE